MSAPRRDADIVSPQRMDVLRHHRSWLTLGILGVGISHKLQGLLMSIRGNAELIREDMDRQVFNKQFLDDIDTALGRIILLTVGLQEAAQDQKMEMMALSLKKCCEEALDYLDPELRKRISIELNFAPDLRPALADRMLFMFMLIELFSEIQKVLGPEVMPKKPRFFIEAKGRGNEMVELTLRTQHFNPWGASEAKDVPEDDFFTAHRAVKVAKSVIRFFQGQVKFSKLPEGDCVTILLPVAGLGRS